MDLMNTISFNNKKIRFHFLWSLIFSFLFISCSENKKETPAVSIQWNDQKAEGIVIPMELLTGVSKDSISSSLQVQLANKNTSVLGEYQVKDDAVIFKPLIAFTRGLKYEICIAGKLLTEIEIPLPDLAIASEVLAIYPTNDTVPDNLLKIYIEFSKQMQEGDALKNITVIKNQSDTVPSVFLDQELWNNERTVLTLWLDPGRIKRDLQPNKKLGAPIEQNNNYQIIINRDWQDGQGVLLKSVYQKNFIVGKRDSISPEPSNWTIDKPKAGGRQPLKINLHESLDYVLLKNAIRITDNQGNSINGIIETANNETALIFTPSSDWKTGDYTIEIESRLEDLAGNNLNRLFDKDLMSPGKNEQKKIFTKTFHVD
jgi:hypothetical protein